jgi:acetyl-CoA carboxylase carboxyltransferase component
VALIESRVERTADFGRRQARLEELVEELRERTAQVATGGGEKAIERGHRHRHRRRRGP